MNLQEKVERIRQLLAPALDAKAQKTGTGVRNLLEWVEGPAEEMDEMLQELWSELNHEYPDGQRLFVAELEQEIEEEAIA